jgi:hypothetical protein
MTWRAGLAPRVPVTAWQGFQSSPALQVHRRKDNARDTPQLSSDYFLILSEPGSRRLQLTCDLD